ASAAGAAETAAAEQRFEEVAEVAGIGAGKAAAAKLEVRIPARGRSGIPPRRRSKVGVADTRVAPLAELIVGGALFRILQDLVGLADFAELLGSRFFVADVLMILARQLTIGALDFALISVTFDAQNLVVVLVLHSLCPIDQSDTMTNRVYGCTR